MIRVNEDFEFERDSYGWQLHQWKDGVNKKKEPTRTKHTTYHANLSQVCSAVIDRTAGHASDLHEIMQLVDMTKGELKIAIEGVEK